MFYTNLDSTTLLLSAFGGILPALVWLWFWLREDKMHPEPRGRLILCFLSGMAGVIVAYPFERGIYNLYGIGTLTLFLWAIIEELLKYGAAGFTGLFSKDFDEPVDGLVYMITAALGFSALENTMFLLGHISDGASWLQVFATGQMRFIGASLLHVISSAAIGYAAARAFYYGRKAKILFRLSGIAIAIALHTFFNLFIIEGNDRITFSVFGMVWAVAIVLLLLFEKIKKLSH